MVVFGTIGHRLRSIFFVMCFVLMLCVVFASLRALTLVVFGLCEGVAFETLRFTFDFPSRYDSAEEEMKFFVRRGFLPGTKVSGRALPCQCFASAHPLWLV